MNRRCMWSAAVALVCALALVAGCGGGGGGDPAPPNYTLTGVSPSVSADLNGGDRVTITGTNFLALTIAGQFGGRITFGGAIAFNPQVIDDQTIEVTTPGSPGGNPGVVSILFEVPGFPDRLLPNSYTYFGLAGPPQVDTIFPTTYTPSGAAFFSIQGTGLGLPGGTVDVTFEGVGTVTANVSLSGNLATGLAPLVQGTPPSGDLRVFVENGAGIDESPTKVSYDWAAPQPLPVPNQANGPASQPVRISNGLAALCGAGPNGTWGNADDEVHLISGPPNAPGVTTLANVGFLDVQHSQPVRLNDDALVIYSTGVDRAPRTGDDVLVVVHSLTSTAVVTKHAGLPFYTNTTRPLRLSDTEIVLTTAGPFNPPGPTPPAAAPTDEVVIATINGPAISYRHTGPIGPIDRTPNASLSTPFTVDGSFVFLVEMGDATPGNAQDSLVRIDAATVDQGTAVLLKRGAPNLLGAPLALSNSLVVAPGAGTLTTPGSTDDVLMVFREVSGVLGKVDQPIGTAYGVGAPVSAVRFGTGGVALPLAGNDGMLNSGVDEIGLFSDPVLGGIDRQSTNSGALLVALQSGNGAFIALDQGPIGVPGDGDETTLFFDGTAGSAELFASAPQFRQLFVPRADNDRMFAIADPDGRPVTGDERLLVYQTLALTAPVEIAILPIAAGQGVINDFFPFIPVGPNWGVIQSPGPNNAFGAFTGGDDHVVIVRY